MECNLKFALPDSMTKISLFSDFYSTYNGINACMFVSAFNSIVANMTKKILCTTDFSEASNNALKWAISFSLKEDSELTILYTYRLTKNISEELVAWKKRIEKEASGKFAAFEDIWLKGKGIKYQFKIEVGFIGDRIDDHAKNNNLAFLVVDKDMCMKNKDTFDDLLDHMNVPLIIIPNN